MRRALVLWTDPGKTPGPIRPIQASTAGDCLGPSLRPAQKEHEESAGLGETGNASLSAEAQGIPVSDQARAARQLRASALSVSRPARVVALCGICPVNVIHTRQAFAGPLRGLASQSFSDFG